MPSGVYERKFKDPNAPPPTTREKLAKRVPIAFKVIDKCLLDGKGIKVLQLQAAKWIIESDLGKVEKVRASEILPDYEKKILAEHKEGTDATEKGK